MIPVIYIRKHEYVDPLLMANVPVIIHWYKSQIMDHNTKRWKYFRYWLLFWEGGTREQRDQIFDYLCSHSLSHTIDFSRDICPWGGSWCSFLQYPRFYLEAPNPIMDIRIAYKVPGMDDEQ